MGIFSRFKKDYVSFDEIINPKKEVAPKKVSKKVSKRSNSRRGFSTLQKEKVLKNQKNRCANYRRCKNKFKELMVLPHWDHIDRNDSNNKISNCQALCANCHDGKSRLENMQRTEKGRKNVEKWEAANRRGENPPDIFSKEWKQVRDKYPDWSVLDMGL